MPNGSTMTCYVPPWSVKAPQPDHWRRLVGLPYDGTATLPVTEANNRAWSGLPAAN